MKSNILVLVLASIATAAHLEPRNAEPVPDGENLVTRQEGTACRVSGRGGLDVCDKTP